MTEIWKETMECLRSTAPVMLAIGIMLGAVIFAILLVVWLDDVLRDARKRRVVLFVVASVAALGGAFAWWWSWRPIRPEPVSTTVSMPECRALCPRDLTPMVGESDCYCFEPGKLSVTGSMVRFSRQ